MKRRKRIVRWVFVTDDGVTSDMVYTKRWVAERDLRRWQGSTVIPWARIAKLVEQRPKRRKRRNTK